TPPRWTSCRFRSASKALPSTFTWACASPTPTLIIYRILSTWPASPSLVRSGETPMTDTLQRKPLPLPNGQKKVLLHSCCAPCSGEVMEAMQASGIDFTIFFYNPNIHPLKEYELRKDENIRFAEQFGIPFVDADYDRDNWFERAK